MHLGDISRWARGNGLQILLIAIGAVLISRAAHWMSARYRATSRARGAGPDRAGRSGVRAEPSGRGPWPRRPNWAWSALVYFVAGILILSKFGLPLASLVAPATVAGVAIGFGAQQIVADLLAGFFLFAERQFGVGDVIQLAQPGQTTGIRGTVEELTLRVTKLRIATGRAGVPAQRRPAPGDQPLQGLVAGGDRRAHPGRPGPAEGDRGAARRVWPWPRIPHGTTSCWASR